MDMELELTWLDREQPDRRDLDGMVAMQNAARALDAPYLPPFSVRGTAAWLSRGWDGDRPEVAVTRDRHGRVIGVVQVELPPWDNTHLGAVDVTVDPQYRREGLGRHLFEVGAQRIQAAGRRLLISQSYASTPGMEFLKAIGLDRVYEETLRSQDLVGLDWDRLTALRGEAVGHAWGYELVRLPGAVPRDLVADVARLSAAINDAPTDDLDIEDEVYSPERIRAFEAASMARGGRVYRLVARERRTGALAGQTLVEVASDSPWNGNQLDTSVVAEHRGHRLGLLLKAAMLLWLREEEPALRTIYTDNATSNVHMVRVNELLGYRVIGKAVEWQRHL